MSVGGLGGVGDRLPDLLPAELLGAVDRRRARDAPLQQPAAGQLARACVPAGKPSSAAYGIGSVCCGQLVADARELDLLAFDAAHATHITCPSGPPSIIACNA